MLYFENEGIDRFLSEEDIKLGLNSALDKLSLINKSLKILILPPDISRFHSRAGLLTIEACQYFKNHKIVIMPTLGTHKEMSPLELNEMFPGLAHSLFKAHNWREDLHTLGLVPKEFIKDISDGMVHFDWPAQVNKILVDEEFDLILSIGQVVPHEVIGFANHNKNIFIGIGGSEAINKSHYLGAVYGMEKIMGEQDSPVRRVLNYASDYFAKNLPILYALTVVSPDKKGDLAVKGLFIGDGYECFCRASDLSARVNITMVQKPFSRLVVFLDPHEYKSTWIGNKAIYRTRMAMADKGELIIIAPGLDRFGEDETLDKNIRKYGYFGTNETLKKVKKFQDLKENLSAAAHLIHGSSEDRFSISYAPGHLSQQEIESVGYKYTDLNEAKSLFQIDQKEEGYHKDKNGIEFYYIKNPAMGLWKFSKKEKRGE